MVLERIKSGIEVAFDTGKILFSDLLSGEIIDVDKDTQVVNGVVSNFPDKFDPEEYFERNNINNTSLINFVKESSVLNVLRDIKLTDNIATRTVLGLIAERVNQGINKQRGVTGGHNFKVDPQAFLRILKEKGEVNFLDLIGEYAIAHLGDQAREFLTGKVNLSDVLDGTSDISVNELAMMLRVARKGGDIGFDDQSMKYYGEYYGGRLDTDNYLENTRYSLIGNIELQPVFKNLFPYCYSQRTVGVQPEWDGIQDVVATYQWPEDASDQVKINANPYNDKNIVIWWSDDPTKLGATWKRGVVLRPSFKQRTITKKGEYFRFGVVTGSDEPTVSKQTVHFEGEGFIDPVTVDTEDPVVFDPVETCPQGYDRMDVFMAADLYENGSWYPRWETSMTADRFVTEVGQRYTFRQFPGATPQFAVRFLFTNDARLQDYLAKPNKDTNWVREEVVEPGKSLTIDSPGRYVFIAEHIGNSTGSTDEFEPYGKTQRCWQMERIGADCSAGFTEVRQYKSNRNTTNYDVCR